MIRTPPPIVTLRGCTAVRPPPAGWSAGIELLRVCRPGQKRARKSARGRPVLLAETYRTPDGVAANFGWRVYREFGTRGGRDYSRPGFETRAAAASDARRHVVELVSAVLADPQAPAAALDSAKAVGVELLKGGSR